MKCAHDDCTVTGELKKGKYVYYRCSGGRGPCELPRFREQDLAEMFGKVVGDISIPREVARMDAAYCDKFDGKISEDFWQRKQAEWQAEELRITSRLEGLKEQNNQNTLADVRRILELTQNAYSQYLTRKPAEQAELLKTVLWNCASDDVSLYPT